MNQPNDNVRKVEDVCQFYVEQLQQTAPGVMGALVSTRDGFEVALHLHPSFSGARLSAMSSSLLSVADAMSATMRFSKCKNVVIEAEGGRILLMEIPARAQHLQLSAYCMAQANLGQLLWPIRECCSEMGRALDALQP